MSNNDTSQVLCLLNMFGKCNNECYYNHEKEINYNNILQTIKFYKNTYCDILNCNKEICLFKHSYDHNNKYTNLLNQCLLCWKQNMENPDIKFTFDTKYFNSSIKHEKICESFIINNKCLKKNCKYSHRPINIEEFKIIISERKKINCYYGEHCKKNNCIYFHTKDSVNEYNKIIEERMKTMINIIPENKSLLGKRQRENSLDQFEIDKIISYINLMESQNLCHNDHIIHSGSISFRCIINPILNLDTKYSKIITITSTKKKMINLNNNFTISKTLEENKNNGKIFWNFITTLENIQSFEYIIFTTVYEMINVIYT